MAKLTIKHMLIGLGLVLVLSLSDQPRAIAQDSGRVGLVVQFDEETILAGCLDIGGQELNGQDILQLSGLDLDLYYDASQEVAVCRINELGCESGQCFCHFPDYWSYWHTEGNEWVYSGRGASTHMTQPGTVEGWRWGSGVPPLQISFEQICSSSVQGDHAAPIGGGGREEPGIQLLPLKPGPDVPDSGLDSQISSAPAQSPDSLGYVVFGAALVSMGVGFLLILKKRHG